MVINVYGPVGMVLLNASDEHKGTDIDRHPFIDKCEENARSKEQDEHPEDYFLDYFHAVLKAKVGIFCRQLRIDN